MPSLLTPSVDRDAPVEAAGPADRDDRRAAGVAALLTATGALVLYLATLAPSIAWSHQGSDSGELVAAAYTLGVPHPTGYPLFAILAHLATYLPTGDPARSVNVFDAVCGAVAVGLIAWLAADLARPGRRAIAALAAGGLLAVTPLFWSQAILAEVYALAAALLAAVLVALTRWRREWPDPKAHRWLVLAAFCFGLALAHHATVAFLAPALALAVAAVAGRRVWRPQFWIEPVVAVLPGLGLYLYLPWRAAARPPVNWGLADTWEGFLWVVLAAPYRAKTFQWELLLQPAQYADLAALVVREIPLPALLIAGWGAVRLIRQDRVWGALLVLVALIPTIQRLTYSITHVDAYYIPLLQILAVWTGIGLSQVADGAAHFRARSRRAVYLGLLTTVIVLATARAATVFDAMDLSRETAPREFGIATLEAVPPSAVLLTQRDDYTFSLWYAQYVLGVRLDVALVQDRMLSFPWYQEHLRRLYPDLEVGDLGDKDGSRPIELIRQNLGHRPVVLADSGIVPLLRLYFEVQPIGEELVAVIRDRRESDR
ncbi:MAG TPA: DUF2723 domain-containing protein [Dehalococcoidia bacterium]|nr:DUF2723 domain-containing protein [Dehalococcoidia bacterium]